MKLWMKKEAKLKAGPSGGVSVKAIQAGRNDSYRVSFKGCAGICGDAGFGDYSHRKRKG